MNRRTFAVLGGAALLLLPSVKAGDDKMKMIDKLMMFSVAVTDMPKAKAFYSDKLGFKIASDNRIDDHQWWVGLALPGGGPVVTLTTSHENMKPGTMKLYFAISDVAAAFRTLSSKGAKVNEIKATCARA